MKYVKINHKNLLDQEVTIPLPGSKSETNRALIIKALAKANKPIQNMAIARDSETMEKEIISTAKTIDVLDAGTTMRFLTAYFTATNQNKIMTGTDRMKQRPIGILINALSELGAEIEYLEKEGYPPHEIKNFSQQKTKLQMEGSISSQFISAVLMIAPTLPKGLTLTLTGKIASRPYIDLTLNIMRVYGAKADWVTYNQITVTSEKYKNRGFTVESDWSGASYWYAMVAAGVIQKVTLSGLRKHSFQGDSRIASIMEDFGVSTTYGKENLVFLKKTEKLSPPHEIDFSDCPDLAQTMAVVCTIKNISIRFTGIESLKIKETDRVTALQNELSKWGYNVFEETGSFDLSGEFRPQPSVILNTYDDHRMAMAFAPLGAFGEIIIEKPEVVNKSYPTFWDDCKKIGLEISYMN